MQRTEVTDKEIADEWRKAMRQFGIVRAQLRAAHEKADGPSASEARLDALSIIGRFIDGIILPARTGESATPIRWILAGSTTEPGESCAERVSLVGSSGEIDDVIDLLNCAVEAHKSNRLGKPEAIEE